MSSSAALASAAEPAMSTLKPISPSFDFKMPERRSSSSITRSRNDSSPALRSPSASLSTQHQKFKTVLARPRENPRQSVKTALKDPYEAFGSRVPREERSHDIKRGSIHAAGCGDRLYWCDECAQLGRRGKPSNVGCCDEERDGDLAERAQSQRGARNSDLGQIRDRGRKIAIVGLHDEGQRLHGSRR